MEITTQEYKKNLVFVIKEGKRIYLSFGLRKAKLIIEHLEAIKGFIKEAEGKDKKEVKDVSNTEQTEQT